MGIFEDKVIKYVPRMMKDFEIQDFHAFGIFGNMGTETGGFKYMQEIKPVVKGSRGGCGWSMWTGPRRKKFEAWAKEKGMDINADETNYQFLVHETLTDEWKSLAQLRKTTTLEAATETWMLLNLRPGIPHLEDRIKWARKAADAFKSSGGTKIPGKIAATTGAVIAAGAGAAYVPTNYLPYVAAAVIIPVVVYTLIKLTMRLTGYK